MAAKAGSSSLSKLPVAARFAVSASVLFLVGVAYFVMGYGEISSQIAAQKNQEAALRAELAKARASESAYLVDLGELTDKQQRQRELNKVLPEGAEYPSFLSAIQGVANVTGVSLNSWDPLDEQPQQFFAKVPMKLTLMGRFHQVAKFFYGVGQLDRIINLENIIIKEPKREADDVFVKVECLATAFHTIPQKAPAPPKPGTPAASAAAAASAAPKGSK